MKYETDSTRPIEAETMREAAEIAAERIARRTFGKRARVGALRCDCWTQDCMSATYEAFIGRRTGLHEITGRNIWFTVYAPKGGAS